MGFIRRINMKVFLVCNKYGDVIDVLSSKTFEEAYANTVELNNGELLVEIDKHIPKEIEKLHD
jgi:hypothetical protein